VYLWVVIKKFYPPRNRRREEEKTLGGKTWVVEMISSVNHKKEKKTGFVLVWGTWGTWVQPLTYNGGGSRGGRTWLQSFQDKLNVEAGCRSKRSESR